MTVDNLKVRLAVFLEDDLIPVKPYPVLSGTPEQIRDVTFEEIRSMCEDSPENGGYGRRVGKLLVVYS